MSYFALVLNADFGYARAHCVRAESHEVVGETLLLRRGDRVVHQAPTDLVARLEPFPSHAAATAYIERLMDVHGAAALHVKELGSTRKAASKAGKRAGGLFAESLSVQIVGTARHPGGS